MVQTNQTGHTLTEKIFSRNLGRPVSAGEMVVVQPDVAMGHDSLSPGIIKIMREQLGIEKVANPEQIVMVMDHVAPASTVGNANAQAKIRAFAKEQGIRLFDVGRGICHQVLVEEEIAGPGKIIIGSDSHSTSYGAVTAFGTGMGSTDIALCWGTGQAWFRIPETIRLECRGQFNAFVDAKDLALWFCRQLSIAGATYEAIEYHGLDWLPLNEKQTISSMAIELGAKAGIFPLTDNASSAEFDWLSIDENASYSQTVSVDLDQLQPQVAVPHSVDDVVDLTDVAGRPIDVVFLGTCTNGRAEDLAKAAEVVDGKQLAIRLIVTPASRWALQQSIADGSMQKLLDAGATLTTLGAALAWVGIRGPWQKVNGVCRRVIETSAVGWDHQILKSIWLHLPSPPRRHSQVKLPIQEMLKHNWRWPMSRIWQFGRDVDTDQIVPGRYAPYMRPDADVGTAAFIEAHPVFNEHAQPGDLIVADDNFGCGSSREYAPQALKNREIAAIIAKSFARIFYRNAINLGLPVFVAPLVVDQVSDGQLATIDVVAAQLEVEGKTFQLPALPEFALHIIDAGGIASYVKEHGRFPEAIG